MSLEKIYNDFVSRFNKHKEEDTQEFVDKKVESIIINGCFKNADIDYSEKFRFIGILNFLYLKSLRDLYKRSSYYMKDHSKGRTIKIKYKKFLITIDDIYGHISGYSITELSDKD